MPDNETIFKPRYSGRTALALFFWPVSAIAFVFFGVDTIRTSSYYSEGLLALMFALGTLGPLFMYFREVRFGEEALVVRRYFLPDVVMPYADVTGFQYFSLRSAAARVPLSNLDPKSFEELDHIIDRLIDAGKLKLKKRR